MNIGTFNLILSRLGLHFRNFLAIRLGILYTIYLDSLLFAAICILIFKILFYLIMFSLPGFYLNFLIFILSFTFNLGFPWSYDIKLYAAKVIRIGLGYGFCWHINFEQQNIEEKEIEQDYTFYDRCYYNNFIITFLYEHNLLNRFNKIFYSFCIILLRIRLEILFHPLFYFFFQSYIFYLLLINNLPIITFIITLIIIMTRILSTLFFWDFDEVKLRCWGTTNCKLYNTHRFASIILSWIAIYYQITYENHLTYCQISSTVNLDDLKFPFPDREIYYYEDSKSDYRFYDLKNLPPDHFYDDQFNFFSYYLALFFFSHLYFNFLSFSIISFFLLNFIFGYFFLLLFILITIMLFYGVGYGIRTFIYFINKFSAKLK